MAVRVLTDASCIMVGLSSDHSPIGVLLYNVLLSDVRSGKYTNMTYTSTHHAELLSTREWLGCLAWEIETTVTLLCSESTPEIAEPPV